MTSTSEGFFLECGIITTVDNLKTPTSYQLFLKQCKSLLSFPNVYIRAIASVVFELKGCGWQDAAEVTRGAAEEGKQEKKWGQAGGTAVGPSLCSASPLSLTVPCFGGQHLQPALHAKHTLPRGRLHMGLRGQKKSIPQAALGEEGGGSLQQPRSLQLGLPPTPPPPPHIKTGDAIMRTEGIVSIELFSCNLQPENL